MVWLGWTLGIIESVCITVVVGLSVDYVVHFANSYTESYAKDRESRVTDALTVMGISVFSAALTTIGSAIILLFTTILFFAKFGAFIVLSIFFSFLVSFFFLFAMLAAFGPQGDFMSFEPFLN